MNVQEGRSGCSRSRSGVNTSLYDQHGRYFLYPKTVILRLQQSYTFSHPPSSIAIVTRTLSKNRHFVPLHYQKRSIDGILLPLFIRPDPRDAECEQEIHSWRDMHNEGGMHMRPLRVSRDGHDRIAVDNEALLLTGNFAFELDLLVLDVFVMDGDV